MKQISKVTLFFLSFALVGNVCGDVLKCHLSDRWYPSRSKTLRKKMIELQIKAKTKYQNKVDAKKIKAIIVPHAGFNYSGLLASGVYQNLKPKIFDRIIVVAPSHHSQFNGIALPGVEYSSYKSPLRQIRIDQAFVKKLKKKSSLFDYNHHVHELEHSIEIQIPFIQKYCGFCDIVPLIVGNLNFSQVQQVADFLNSVVDKKTLIVVSADLTHYGNMSHCTQFESDILENIFKIDQQLIDAIVFAQSQKFAKIIQTTGDAVCGKNAILILLSMIQKKCFGDVAIVNIGHETSFQPVGVQNYESYVGMIIAQKDK